MTPEEYANLVENTYTLIINEIDSTCNLSRDDKQVVYPKLVFMYEFFRFLRGEAFFDSRPLPIMEGKQKEFYKMEDTILSKLREVKKSTDIKSPRTQYHLEQLLKGHFDSVETVS